MIWLLSLYVRNVLLQVSMPMFLHYASLKLSGLYMAFLFSNPVYSENQLLQALTLLFPSAIWSMETLWKITTELPYPLYLLLLAVLITVVSLLCGFKMKRRLTHAA